MSLKQITQSLSRLTLEQLQRSMLPVTSVTVRNFHCTAKSSKNFFSRLPKATHLKLPRYRLERNVDLNKYTLKPLNLAKTGGRGLDGRIWIHKIGGGDKIKYRMIDYKRHGPTEGEPLTERVNAIVKDDIVSARLAVVASGNRKRYIIASENMKEGDLIVTSGKLTAMTVRAFEGDAHPIGSLPVGTMVHSIERYPGEGGKVALAAGTCGMYLRKIGDKCVIRMPSKREMIVSQTCMVTVGRVSNPDHYKTKKMTTAGQNRNRGRRPCSGLWQRKTGYHGRKIKPMKTAVYEKKEEEKPEPFKYTFE